MSEIVKLADQQKPAPYTIEVTHHYSGKVEIIVLEVSDDNRSIKATSIRRKIIPPLTTQEPADE